MVVLLPTGEFHVKIGRCRLCLRANQELQNSHFISAAIYKVCKSRNKQPIPVGGGPSRPTGRHIADELLCRACEQRFSKYGEAWTIKNMARRRRFRIQAILENAQPTVTNNRLAVFGQVAGIDVERLVYFALSIFWRASVHRWRDPDTDRIVETISLGDFEEPIRQFLVSGTTWPSHVVVLVSVWPCRNPPLIFRTPVVAKQDGFENFEFSIPGITFKLATDSGIPDNLRQMCSQSLPRGLITVEMTQDSQRDQSLRQPTKALRKES
jgi:hypothetical protein